MTLPDIDSLNTYAGAMQNYSAVVDPTRDRDAGGANQAYASVAGMTATLTRAWCCMTLNSTATPVLVAHNSNWGNAIGVAPTPVRVNTGIYTVTWPATVSDQIPNGYPGYNAAHALNLRAGWGNLQATTIAYDVFVTCTSANVATVRVFNVAGSLADPSAAINCDVFVI